jgi:PhnB protein
MLSDELPQSGARSAKSIGGSPVRFTIYVPDVDAAFGRAVDAGCKVVRPVADMFYGDRAGCVEDPFGLAWTLMTHIKDVSPEEMKRHMAEHLEKSSKPSA